MDAEAIKQELDKIEASLERGDFDLKALGFWRVVHYVKRSTQREQFAEQVGRIESKASGRKIRFKLGVMPGNASVLVATILGVLLLSYGAISADLRLKSASMALASLILSFSTHPLAHYFIGKRYGIRFLYYYPNGPARVEPTLKIDYASYLLAAPEQRAAMHLAGVVATVGTSFLCLLIGIAAGVAAWAQWFLLAYFLLMLGSDLLLSPKMGDLKRYNREKRYAKGLVSKTQ